MENLISHNDEGHSILFSTENSQDPVAIATAAFKIPDRKVP